jgi:hypothetical protein
MKYHEDYEIVGYSQRFAALRKNQACIPQNKSLQTMTFSVVTIAGVVRLRPVMQVITSKN